MSVFNGTKHLFEDELAGYSLFQLFLQCQKVLEEPSQRLIPTAYGPVNPGHVFLPHGVVNT